MSTCMAVIEAGSLSAVARRLNVSIAIARRAVIFPRM
jgi:hypothetical protein